MLFEIGRLQNDDLILVLNKMEPVPFARFRQTNKTMLEYVEANARHIGVRTDYSFIWMFDKEYSHAIHSGYSFNCIGYWGNDDDYFTTRKCRTVHLHAGHHREIPLDVLMKLGPPRNISWGKDTLPVLPKSVIWLKVLLVEDIVDWTQFDGLETCILLPKYLRKHVPALRSINCLLEHWERGVLEKLQRFQSGTRTIKDLSELNNKESFLSSLSEQLPSNLVEKLQFTEIDEEDQKKWKVSMMASTKFNRKDGALAIVAAYQIPRPPVGNRYQSNTRCQIRFHAEEPVSLLPPTWFKKRDKCKGIMCDLD